MLENSYNACWIAYRPEVALSGICTRASRRLGGYSVYLWNASPALG